MMSEQVRRRLNSLTKPPGSLGQLEAICIRYAELRGEEPPRYPRSACYVFCGDHGVTAEGVSAWPQSVTRQMMANFVAGGAAINVLCRQAGIEPVVVDVGVCGEPVRGVRDARLREGTRNFAEEPAMTREEARAAMITGRSLALEAARSHDLLLCGEMGIGNTTSATALLCAYAGLDPHEVTGAGAGLPDDRIAHKANVIGRALERHCSRDPLDIAACFGGFEILAMAGFFEGAASARVPVLVDGFIAGAAALVVRALEPHAMSALWFSHCSAEKGHRAMLRHIGVGALLDLEMRLGEGTGAALALLLVRSAFRLYHEMATFERAGVGGS